MGCGPSTEQAAAAAAALRRRAENFEVSALCEQLRDPFTIAISFMHNPGPFRRASSFTLECWNQAIYLEVELKCPVVFIARRDQWSEQPVVRACPFLFRLMKHMPMRGDQDPGLMLQTYRAGKRRGTARKHHLIIPPFENNDSGFAVLARLYSNPLYSNCWSSTVKKELRIRKMQFSSVVEGLEVDTGLFDTSKSLEELTFRHMPYLSSIGHCSVKFCPRLHTVTLQNIHGLHQIENNFLYNCTALTKVTMKEIWSLRIIAHNCIKRCPALKSISLENLPKLTSIGSDFLYEASCLEAVTFSHLPQLKKVGAGWLQNCTGLKTANIEFLPELETVGSEWLQGCTSLEKITFRELPKLKPGDVWFPADSSTNSTTRGNSHNPFEPLDLKQFNYEDAARRWGYLLIAFAVLGFIIVLTEKWWEKLIYAT